MLAAGLHGIEQELELPPPLEGNAYESDAKRFPHTLRDAIARSSAARSPASALGDEVVDHYLNYARTEQRLFDEVVTCYERERQVRARMKPLIGITSYAEKVQMGVWNEQSALVPLVYVRAVENAGGRPLVIPPVDGAVEETLDALTA